MKTAKLFLFPLRRAKSRRDGTLLTVCFSLRTFSLRAILLLAPAFFSCANLSAQVTIGGTDRPKNGAILDLNSTAKGGLILSNVTLPNLYTIPSAFPGITDPVDAGVKEKFTGSLVYHAGTSTVPAGIYVWNGTNWTPATENCTAPAWTLNVPPLVRTGENVVFSVSSDASPRCTEGETYVWSVSEDNGNTYSPLGSGASITVSFNVTGNYRDYRIKAAVTSPYSPASVEKEATVTVITQEGEPAPGKLNAVYGIVGETCLDVKKTGQGNAAVYAGRKDGFPDDNFTKTYQFVHGGNYTGLYLSYFDDPAKDILEDISLVTAGSGEEEIKVTFKPEVKDLASNTTPLTVKLVASYIPDGSTDAKLAYLEIRIEDRTCICPAKKSATEWLNFMCHNLGGLDIISPSQLITYKHQGDWYRFGTKAPSLVNDGTNNVLNWIESGNSAFPPYYSSDAGYPNAGNWPDDLNADIGNPCPAGWKLPTNDEWKAVITNNTATNVPASWVSASALTFSNLKKLGNELMLPAAGGRTSAATAEGQGNSGRYYSSTNYKSNYAWYMRFNNDANLYTSNVAYRSSPLSVRCIAAE